MWTSLLELYISAIQEYSLKKVFQATFSVTTEFLGFDKINLKGIRLKGIR